MTKHSASGFGHWRLVFGASGSPMLRLLAACLLPLLLASCQPGPIGPAASTTTQAAVVEVVGDSSAAGARTGDELVEETWDAYSMQGQRIGYGQTSVFKVVEDGRGIVKTRQFVHLEFSREGQAVRQEVTTTSWETPEGGLVRFETQMKTGPGEMISRGRVEQGELVMEVGTLGHRQTVRIPWQADWGGPFAVEQSLKRQAMQPGESRTVRGLTVLNVVGESRLKAEDYEEVELPAGKAKLLKVHAVADVAGQRIEHDQWVNERGEVLKSLVYGANQESVRTTKEDALRSGGGKLDLLAASVVPVAEPIAKTSARVVYRARVKSGSIEGLFSHGLSQRVKPVDEKTAEITVLAVRPDRPEKPDVPQTPPTAGDRAPGSFVQSDDPLIAELAKSVQPRETDPWKVACALEAFVNQAIQEKSLSQAFASAAEVARTQEGDCTEHAVLLAALCRARGIAARGVFGLVYYAPKRGFAYHMWNEVWIQDRWAPIDGTLALGGIGADHIKLGDSNLSGGSPLADLLAVAQIFGRLELEVIERE